MKTVSLPDRGLAERRNFGFLMDDREIAHDVAYKKIEGGAKSYLEFSSFC